MPPTSANAASSTAPPTPTPQPLSATPSSSFLPLTTVFPVPTSCFKEMYTAIFTSPDITAFRDYEAAFSECYPESYGQFEYPTVHPGSSWYSPGVCPSGYPIASSYYDNEASATRAWCCPGPQNNEWVPTFPWGGWSGRRVCISTVTTSTSLILTGRTTILTDFFSAYDWPISVMWAQSDLTKFTPISAPLLDNDASTASMTRLSGTSTSTSTPSPKPTPIPPGSPGLSTGAQAGIGVGVAILVLVLLAVGLIFYRRRKAKQIQQPANMVQTVPAAEVDPGKGTRHRPTVAEMDSNNTWIRSELDGRPLPAHRAYRPD